MELSTFILHWTMKCWVTDWWNLPLICRQEVCLGTSLSVIGCTCLPHWGCIILSTILKRWLAPSFIPNFLRVLRTGRRCNRGTVVSRCQKFQETHIILKRTCGGRQNTGDLSGSWLNRTASLAMAGLRNFVFSLFLSLFLSSHFFSYKPYFAATRVVLH